MQISSQNMQYQKLFLAESLDLVFPHCSQPHIIAESSITTIKKIIHLAERRTYNCKRVNQVHCEVSCR